MFWFCTPWNGIGVGGAVLEARDSSGSDSIQAPSSPSLSPVLTVTSVAARLGSACNVPACGSLRASATSGTGGRSACLSVPATVRWSLHALGGSSVNRRVTAARSRCALAGFPVVLHLSGNSRTHPTDRAFVSLPALFAEFSPSGAYFARFLPFVMLLFTRPIIQHA